MAAGVLIVVLLVSIVAFLILYGLIRSEASSTTVTDRADAERDARAFGGRDGSTRRD